MVVAALSPHNAWRQPILQLIDTAVGVAVGVAVAWLCTYAIAGDRAGNIWVSQEESLFHLRDGTVMERIPWAKLSHPDGARALVAEPLGGLWLAFRNGGVGYFKDGRIRASYTVAEGLGGGNTRDIQLDREGTVWASTEGGLSRLKDGHVATLSNRNGLPCDSVHWVMEDGEHAFWLYMACGLVRLARTELDAWAVTANTDPRRRVEATVFEVSDGVRSHSRTTSGGRRKFEEVSWVFLNGIDAIIGIRSEFPNARVIVLTTYAGMSRCCGLLKRVRRVTY